MIRARAPVALAVPALAAVALVLLPLAYLILRAGSGGLDALRVLGRPGTLDLVVKTGVAVAAVTIAALAARLPLAWLIARTDLPARAA